MTKDVLISISGLHFDISGDNGSGEPVEIITPASYYLKNGKHYILYDEVVEGLPGKIKNTIKITDSDMFEIRKSGIANAHMVFERGKMNMTSYDTPFGEMMIGIHTRNITTQVEQEKIDVHITYTLDVNNEPLTDCEIDVKICPIRSEGGDAVSS